MQTPRVVVEALVFDAFGAFFAFAQMQHGAFVMLREVRQRQFFDELRDQRLRFRPKPRRAEVQAAAVAARRRENASAKAIARLEDRNVLSAQVELSRQRQTA